MNRSSLSQFAGNTIIAFSLLFSLPVLAQDASPSSSPMTSPIHRPAGMHQEDLKERIADKREAMQRRLANIRDERKREIVERIDRRMDELNANRVEHFSRVLDRLEEILKKIVARADRAAERGLDVAPVRAAVDAANAAIDTARALIPAQSGKTYTIQVAGEATLRTNVGKARQALHADLKKIFEAVRAARKSVHDAATTLAKLHGTAASPSPTVSGFPSTSPSPTSTPSPSVTP